MEKNSRDVGKRNLKILNVISGAPTGGAEKFFERMSLSLSKNNNLDLKVTIRKNSKRHDFFLQNKIDVLELNFLNRFDLYSKHKFKKFCLFHKPDIIFTWMNRATSILHEEKYNNEVRVGRLGGFYNLKNYIYCDYLVANTEEIKKYIISKGWDKDKVFYLPNFVDANKSLKLRIKKKKKNFTILGVGRFHKNKNFETILKSIKNLENCELWLVGEGSLKKNYFELAEKYKVENRLKIYNWTDNISWFYNSADVLVCSSIIEPLGNVIIESWAHQLPVISTDVMGPSKLIRHKHNGLKFEKKNVRQLSNCLNLIKENKKLRMKLIDNGFNEYKKKFSEKSVMNKYFNFFNNIVN